MTFGNGPAVAALAALAWRTRWEGGPPIKRLKTDEVPKTPENGPKPGSRFDYTPKYLSCMRKCLPRPSETGRPAVAALAALAWRIP